MCVRAGSAVFRLAQDGGGHVVIAQRMEAA
jgi:hypothetical protein